MKAFFTKISSVVLALLVLCSTFSFTVEKHFCGDFLVDVSYFGNAKSCAEEMEGSSCEEIVVKKKSCCKDKLEKIEGQDDLKISSLEKITFEQQFAILFTVSYHNLFVPLTDKKVSNQEYSPPNLVSDIQVLHEVFII